MISSRHPATHLLALAFMAGLVGNVQAETTATAPPPVSTAEQIDQYLRTSPVIDLPDDGAIGITSGRDEPRKVHGEVSVGVGTGGYRSVYMRSDMPVGKTGTLSIAVEDTRFKGGYGRGFGGYGYGYGGPRSSQNLGVGLAFGGAASGRRSCDTPGPSHRIDPGFLGGEGSRRCFDDATR